LQGAKDKIKSDKKNIDSNVEVIEKLQSIKHFLTKLKEEL